MNNDSTAQPVILIIDDLLPCLEALKKGLEDSFASSYNYKVLTHHVLPGPNEEIDKTITRSAQELANILDRYEVRIIIADRGLYRQEIRINKHDIPKICVLKHEVVNGAIIRRNNFVVEQLFFGPNNCFDISKNGRQNLDYLMIRTYRKELHLGDVTRIEKAIRGNLHKHTLVRMIETSFGFRTYEDADELYLDQGDSYLVNDNTRAYYDKYFSYVLNQVLKEEFIDKKSKSEYIQIGSYNYEYETMLQIKNVSTLVPVISNDGDVTGKPLVQFDTDLNPGHLTFISNLFSEGEDAHVLDVPRKDYTQQIIKNLEADDWSEIYKNKEGIYEDDKWVYVEYSYKNGVFHIHNKYDRTRDKELIFTILPSLHATVFYSPEAYNSRVKYSEDKGQVVGLYFFYSGLHLNDLDNLDLYKDSTFHLNYTFWKFLDHDEEYSEAKVEEQSIVIRTRLAPVFRSISLNSILPILLNQRVNLEEENIKVQTENAKIIAQREFTRNHAHTIKSVVPDLAVLIDRINYFVETKRSNLEILRLVKDAQTRAKIVSLVTQVSHGILDDQSNFVKELPTLLHIIKFFIKNNSYVEKTNCLFSIEENLAEWFTENIKYNTITYSKIDALYLLFWNLLNNAAKQSVHLTTEEDYSGGKVDYCISISNSENGEIDLLIKNQPAINEENKNYLLSSDSQGLYPGRTDKSKNRKRGLEVIKECIEVLNWRIKHVDNSNGFTSITIGMNKLK